MQCTLNFLGFILVILTYEVAEASALCVCVAVRLNMLRRSLHSMLRNGSV